MPLSANGAAQTPVSNVGSTPPPKPKPVKLPSQVSSSLSKKMDKKVGKVQAKAKAAAKSKPKKPSKLAKYLAGDTTYQQQLSDFLRSKSDYTSEYNRQTGIVERDYAETNRALQRQGEKDRIDQQNDFAGRGILRSGVFAKALGDYNTEFNQRVKALSTGENDKLGDLLSQKTSFLRQLQQQQAAAKQDAIRRRAAQLGI